MKEPLSIVYDEDCLIGMKRYPDKHFDLAIVDPPYGIGADSQKESYSQGKNGEGRRHRKNWERKGWDDAIPAVEYWAELFRVSKSQNVWGGNYMTEHLKPSKCWLIWDKMQEFTGSDFEMAWTSFDKASKAFRMTRIEAYSNNNKNEKDTGIKIHPTQKPIKLVRFVARSPYNTRFSDVTKFSAVRRAPTNWFRPCIRNPGWKSIRMKIPESPGTT